VIAAKPTIAAMGANILMPTPIHGIAARRIWSESLQREIGCGVCLFSTSGLKPSPFIFFFHAPTLGASHEKNSIRNGSCSRAS
jgi:hypothetical protein